jgi:NADP-dependent 3-hydroxy acid dehydrogenase YdfG
MANPVLVVVGAGPGVGEAVARRFGRDGYDVALVARTESTLAELGGRLRADGITTDWATAEMADPQSLTAALQALGGHRNRVDVLHHNASAFRSGRTDEVSAADLLADLAVGAASLLTAVQAVLPLMRERGSGTVLVTGGGAADRPMAGAATLGVQKAAIRNLIQAMDADLRGEGIHAATVVVKGIIKEGTPFAVDRVADLLFSLAAETARPPDDWRTVVDLTE